MTSKKQINSKISDSSKFLDRSKIEKEDMPYHRKLFTNYIKEKFGTKNPRKSNFYYDTTDLNKEHIFSDLMKENIIAIEASDVKEASILNTILCMIMINYNIASKYFDMFVNKKYGPPSLKTFQEIIDDLDEVQQEELYEFMIDEYESPEFESGDILSRLIMDTIKNLMPSINISNQLLNFGGSDTQFKEDFAILKKYPNGKNLLKNKIMLKNNIIGIIDTFSE